MQCKNLNDTSTGSALSDPGLRQTPCQPRRPGPESDGGNPHYPQQSTLQGKPISPKLTLPPPSPPLPLDVRCTGGEDVNGSEAGLLAGWHEDNDGLLGRVLGDSMVHGLGHGQQARLRVADVEALETKKTKRGGSQI